MSRATALASCPSRSYFFLRGVCTERAARQEHLKAVLEKRLADCHLTLHPQKSRTAESGTPKRKKTATHNRLSCKIEYLLRSNHGDGSIASEFFTGNSIG